MKQTCTNPADANLGDDVIMDTEFNEHEENPNYNANHNNKKSNCHF